MDSITRIQNAIDYIEAHLAEDLPIEQIARAAHFSIWHFQRVFGIFVGLGVKQYVRQRRLTEAMRLLATTDRPILDLAFDFQFESQESFTRAFKAQFGLTPGECRKKGQSLSLLHHKPKITLEYLKHLNGGFDMEPRFVQLPEKKVVGFGTKFISILSPDKNNMQKIPALWEKLFQHKGQIPHIAGHDSFGLVEMLPESESKSSEDELYYIAALEVSKLEANAPAGMQQRTIPAGKYALFTHKGKLDKLELTMRGIYGAWLPKAKIELRDAPHLELYDHRFNPTSDDSEFDILLPVK